MRNHKTRRHKIAGALLAASLSFHAAAQTTSAEATSESPSATVQPDLKSLRGLIDTGHPGEALQQIVALRAKNSGTPGLSRIEGLADYAQNNLKEADTAFAAALKEDPKDQESTQMRALTLFRLGRPADAIPLLESVSSAAAKGESPTSKTDPNYLLALCYMDTLRYDDARHALAAQYGFTPDGAGAYLLTARMLLRRDYLPVAETFARKSIEIEPTLPLAHELLGEIALAGNHFEEAIAELEKERAHNPLEPSTYDRLGDAYNRAGQYDQAQRALQQAVLLAPNSTGAYILLGQTLLRKGDPLGAATYLERARDMDPANYITHHLLGQAYRALDRREDASRETEAAQKLQAANAPKPDAPKFEKLH